MNNHGNVNAEANRSIGEKGDPANDPATRSGDRWVLTVPAVTTVGTVVFEEESA